MAQFELHNAGNTEAQQKEAVAYLLAQSSTGKAATGVLSGLGVSQTTTASGSVLVGAGAGVVQAAVLDGASVLVNDSQVTLDVFTANPMSSLPRNDIVVFDAATLSVRVIVGTAAATPTDPTVPSSAIPLARLRNAASATTIPTSAINDLRTFTDLFRKTETGDQVRILAAGTPVDGQPTPPAGTKFYKIAGKFTGVTFNASGLATMSLPGGGFPNGLLWASMQQENATGVAYFIHPGNTSTKTTLTLVRKDTAGNPASGSGGVIWYEATGW